MTYSILAGNIVCVCWIVRMHYIILSLTNYISYFYLPHPFLFRFRTLYDIFLPLPPSTKGFLVVIIFGGLFMATAGCFVIAAAIKWDTEPDPFVSDGASFFDIMCMAWVWLFLFGHICVYMGLYGKLRRIHKVAHLTSRRSEPISVWYGMWPFFVLRVMSFALLLAWSIVEIPKWVIFEYDDGKSFGLCDYTATGQLKFLISLVLLIFVSAVLGAQMAYRARKLPQELTDVNQIFQIYCCHLVIIIIFGSLYIIARVLQLPTALVTANVLLAICESIASVGPLMVPKMYYIWYEHNHNGELPEGVTMIGRGQTHIGGLSPPPQQQQQQQPIINNGDDNS